MCRSFFIPCSYPSPYKVKDEACISFQRIVAHALYYRSPLHPPLSPTQSPLAALNHSSCTSLTHRP